MPNKLRHKQVSKQVTVMNCVTPPTKNYSVKLSNYHITFYIHYYHHHPPHHRTIISDTAPTHWNCPHTPHT